MSGIKEAKKDWDRGLEFSRMEGNTPGMGSNSS